MGGGRGNKRGSVKEGNPTNEIFQYKHKPIFILIYEMCSLVVDL